MFSFPFLFPKPSSSPFFLLSLKLIASFFFNYCFTNTHTHTHTPEYINPMNLYDVTCIEGESMTVTLLTSIIPNYVLNTCPYIHREAYSFPLSPH